MQTSSAGAVSASRVYDVFGNDLSSSGSWSSRFGYAGGFGYQQDPDTGLKLLGHRYYDSSNGRFLTRDPAKDGRNWYGYCAGNPVGKVDCDGYKPVILHYGYALFTKAGEFLKWGITKNPFTRYTKKFLEAHGDAELKKIICSEDRSVVAAWERGGEEKAPGILNNTPWAKKAKEKGLHYALAVPVGANSALEEYERTIDETTPDLESVKNTPFLVSDIICGVEAIANLFKGVGKDLRKIRAERDERLLSTE